MAKAFTIVRHKKVTAPGTPPDQSYKPPSTRERHTHVQINPSDIATKTGAVDYEDFTRSIKLLQDNTADATVPYRTNPLLHGELHTNLITTSGHNLVIAHGLGEPVGYFWSVDAAPGSGAFAGVRVNLSAAQQKQFPDDQYLVLAMSSTGTYAVVLTPK